MHLQPNRKKIKRRNRGIPLIVYFIITMLFSLVCVSLVTGYLYSEFLYSEYLSDMTSPDVNMRSNFMIKSSLFFGGAWAVILVFILLLGGFVQHKFKQLIRNANQLGEGQHDILINTKGPREVRDLAFALERIRKSLGSGG